MRDTVLLPLLALAFLLCTACGGGGSSVPASVAGPTSLLSGTVVDVDGSTAQLAGLSLKLMETGEVARTDPNGRFQFDVAPAGSLRLMLGEDGDSALPDDEDENDDGREDEDEDEDAGQDPDDVFVGKRDVRLLRVKAGERLFVRLRLERGTIAQADVIRDEEGTGEDRHVEVAFQRSSGADDADIAAELELQVEDGEAELEISVRRATSQRRLEALVVAPDGSEESLGLRVVTADGRAKWELETEDGDVLPFRLPALADLEGYVVQVRDADTLTVLLDVEVPALPAVSLDGGEDDDDRPESGERGKARLSAREAGLDGDVEIREELDDGTLESKFSLEAEHLAPGRLVTFYIEDAAAPGSFLLLAQLAAGADGEAEIERDTGDGEVLPASATRAADLIGRRVQIRDAGTDQVLLEGVVPALLAE